MLAQNIILFLTKLYNLLHRLLKKRQTVKLLGVALENKLSKVCKQKSIIDNNEWPHDMI